MEYKLVVERITETNFGAWEVHLQNQDASGKEIVPSQSPFSNFAINPPFKDATRGSIGDEWVKITTSTEPVILDSGNVERKLQAGDKLIFLEIN